MRLAGLCAGLGLVFLVGCGGDSGGGYTQRAFDEFVSGHGVDHMEAKRKPTKKEVDALRKRLKSVKAGSKADFKQGLHVLHIQRDHEDHLWKSVVPSRYSRSAYFRVFGKPDEVKKFDQKFDAWTHYVNDGKVSLKGYYKTGDEFLFIYPPQ